MEYDNLIEGNTYVVNGTVAELSDKPNLCFTCIVTGQPFFLPLFFFKMIKSSELRVGNLLIDVEDRICKVERIYEDDWTAYAIKGAVTTGTPYPIKLTEEILLKVGFDKRGNELIYRLSAIQIRMYSHSGKWYSYLHDIYLGDLIQNVHTLQNFLYVFGKELNTSGL